MSYKPNNQDNYNHLPSESNETNSSNQSSSDIGSIVKRAFNIMPRVSAIGLALGAYANIHNQAKADAIWTPLASHSSEPFEITDDWDGTPAEAYKGSWARIFTEVLRIDSTSGEEMNQYDNPSGYENSQIVHTWFDEDVDNLEWSSTVNPFNTTLTSTAPANNIDPGFTFTYHGLTLDTNPADDIVGTATGMSVPYAEPFKREISPGVYVEGAPANIPYQIPEPETLLLFASGLAFSGILSRKKKK